jgi:hypothetical protein
LVIFAAVDSQKPQGVFIRSRGYGWLLVGSRDEQFGSTRLARELVLPVTPMVSMHLVVGPELDPLPIVSVNLIPRADVPGSYGPAVHVFLAEESAARAAALAAGGWSEGDDDEVSNT